MKAREWAVVILGAFLAGVLAWASPADSTRADPGLALLVSQNMLERGTGWIGEADSPQDHRVQVGGVYYNWGVPLISMPSVWLARQLGYDMRQPEDDAALQELLSALCCSLLFLMLWFLTRVWVTPLPAAVITTVTVFGSPLISTLGTGLWNSAYATVLLTGALLWLARRPGRFVVPGVLVILAGLCRPTAGFFVLGFAGLLASRRRWGLAVATFLGVVVAAIVVALAGLNEVLYYYLPHRLFSPSSQPLSGVMGAMLSPGRGLWVFCPFVLVVWLGVAMERRIWRHPLAVFSVVWTLAHVAGVASRPRWWGGHSFGPRYFAEVMPAVALLAALLWSLEIGAGRRKILAGLFLFCGLPSIAVHSGIGLYNGWAQTWNVEPNIDDHPQLLWDWQYPQWLASERRHEARLIDFQRQHRAPYELGEVIDPSSLLAAFSGWSEPETNGDQSWRWSRREEASVWLDTAPGAPGICALDMVLGSFGDQRLRLSLLGPNMPAVGLGSWQLGGIEPQRRIAGFDCALLGGEVELQFELPDARPTAEDPRHLGVALRSLVITRRPEEGEVDWRDDFFFPAGFSTAEAGWRWSDGNEASLLLPVNGSLTALEIEAWAVARQRVSLSVDDGEQKIDCGVRVIEAGEPSIMHWNLPVAEAPTSSSRRLIRLHLKLPDAAASPEESRQLGIALIRARVITTEAVDG